ncbi:MAG: hypothetical protein P1U63_00915 [Coxiellaceae bacterium]|nr:hypothetical protein [Coxiellaceae bacterium]
MASIETYLAGQGEDNKYDSVHEYLKKLTAADCHSQLVNELSTSITVDESYFYRDQQQMEFLEHRFLPELIQKRMLNADNQLSIWSAGSSNGQELYTVLIMLAELVPTLKQWDVYSIGTDISFQAISNARAGAYSHLAFRTMAERIKQAYFTLQDSKHYVIKQEIQQMAEFTYLNLKDMDYENQIDCKGGFDLIFCRNVFIYLDYELVTRITEKMVQLLNPDGILLLGPADIIQNHVEGAELHQSSGVIYYKKEKNQAVTHEPAVDREEAGINIYPIINGEEKKDSKEKQLEDSGQKEMEGQAVSAVESSERLDVKELQTIAMQCANAADYEKGLEMIEQSLEQNEFDPHGYYIKGLICLGLKQYSDAAAQFKSAIFLNAKFPEAAYHLSLCLQLQGDLQAGKKMMKSALGMASDTDPDTKLIDMPGVTMREFVDVLRNEMDSLN